MCLQVFNVLIASSFSHADRYLLFDQTKHAKSARDVLTLTSFNKRSRIFLRFTLTNKKVRNKHKIT